MAHAKGFPECRSCPWGGVSGDRAATVMCLHGGGSGMPAARRVALQSCPAGRITFIGPPTAAPTPVAVTIGVRPGDVVKLVLERIGYRAAAGSSCGCETMRQRMNELGWRGCWREREELLEWFSAKAYQAGITIDRKMLLAAFKASLRLALSAASHRRLESIPVAEVHR